MQVVYYVKDPRHAMLVDEVAHMYSTSTMICGSVFAGLFFAVPVGIILSAMSRGAGLALLVPFLALYLLGSLAQAHAVIRPFAPVPCLGTICPSSFGAPKDVMYSSDPGLAAQTASPQVVPAAQLPVVASAPAAMTQQMQVQVPPGAVPGQQLTIQAPPGQQVMITLPAGSQPGQLITFGVVQHNV